MRQGHGRRRTAIACAIALGALTLGPVSAQAETITSCGQIITESSVLGQDLDCNSNPGVIINAPNIKLDLAGHTIDDTASAVVNDGHDGVSIADGTITNFQTALFVQNAAENRLTSLVLRDGSIGIGLLGDSNETTIQRNSIINNSGDGIQVQNASGVRILRNRIVSNAQDGVKLDNADQAVIISNLISANKDGIGFRAVDQIQGVVIRKNTISANSDDAILLTGVADSPQILSNAIYGNDVGIHAASGFPNGILAESNTIAGNVTAGISLDGSGNGNRFLSNRIFANRGDGVSVANTDEATFEANNSSDNLGDGFDIDGAQVTLTDNVANRNDLFGIVAIGGVSASGNQADDNGQAAQCSGVTCS